MNTEVVEKYWKPGDLNKVETDNKSFEFNLQSNGRIQQPMKFEIKNIYGGYYLREKSHERLIRLGDIVLQKENWKNESYCDYQSEYVFDFHGIEKALCGKTFKPDFEYFTPKRILVIQMK